MGRIKTDMVKKTAAKLVKMHPTKFSKTFEKNKEALKDTAEIRSKKLRNLLAGYAVRLNRREEGPVRPKKPAYRPATRGRRDFGSRR